MMKFIGFESPDFHARLHELHANSHSKDQEDTAPSSSAEPNDASKSKSTSSSGNDNSSNNNNNTNTTKTKNTTPPPSPPPSPKPHNKTRILARLEAYRSAYLSLTPSNNFDTALYTSVQILAGTTNPTGTSGTAIFRIAFSPQYCNKFGTVHGGAIATLLDGVAQCATAVVDDDVAQGRETEKRGGGGGATRGLQIRYRRPVGVGETVRIECEVFKAGRWGGTIVRSTVRIEEGGEVLALCLMDKEGGERARL